MTKKRTTDNELEQAVRQTEELLKDLPEPHSQESTESSEEIRERLENADIEATYEKLKSISKKIILDSEILRTRFQDLKTEDLSDNIFVTDREGLIREFHVFAKEMKSGDEYCFADVISEAKEIFSRYVPFQDSFAKEEFLKIIYGPDGLE